MNKLAVCASLRIKEDLISSAKVRTFSVIINATVLSNTFDFKGPHPLMCLFICLDYFDFFTLQIYNVTSNILINLNSRL